jgi:hypothetical protein
MMDATENRLVGHGRRGWEGLRCAKQAALAVIIAGVGVLHAATARAAPEQRWCLGFERLFGATWLESSYEREYDSRWVDRQTTFSFLASGAPKEGFSSPRVGLDYLTELGVSVGGAAGVDGLLRHSSYTGADDDPNSLVFVLAPRIGYFIRPLPWLAVWPRAGYTFLVRTRADDRSALTFELPVSLLVADQRVGLMLVPYWEAGIPETGDTLGERGALFSVGVFF